MSSPEVLAYQRARAAVLAMTRPPAAGTTGGAGGEVDPSVYWREELDNIDYLIEATPLILRKLRHHAFHITGIRPYDYRSKGDGRRQHFEARLAALRALDGEALLVPESPICGGFGYEIDGRLYNVDTLKFYEVLVGMERGGVLAPLRATPHPVVCEIGAGWGGFAYQWKTLLPSSTIVIVDFPELFLFSATYLLAAFPDARVVFCDSDEAIDQWRDGSGTQADFVFVPHTRAAQVASLPLDLLVNMVSFQEMTEAQVRAYVALAATAGCPLLYSLNRERSPYNAEISSVSAVLGERYRLTEVTVLGTDYTSAMRKPPKEGKRRERDELGYRHFVGRLATGGLKPATTTTGVVSTRGGGLQPTTTTAGAVSVRSGGLQPASSSSRPAPATTSTPRVMLGMTLYNKAPFLREALDSLLAQSHADFRLVMLDDASSDGTEAIAREYEARDSRVRYCRHQSRQAMIATWREVAEIAGRDWPSAEYFAWVSDHDRWHPQWLARLVEALDADPEAVLAYPITRRLMTTGDEADKGPRLFDTADAVDRAERWRRFCRGGVGAGDMVYGLVRMDALRRAGIFRRVLRPDRLLMAELTLYGRFRQVPAVLWFRRNFDDSSIARQHQSLVLAGDEPRWFSAPPWFQHGLVLWHEYASADPRPLPIGRGRWLGMIARYGVLYAWRHFRKTSTAHAIGRAFDRAIWVKKMTRHYYHHAVYHTLVGGRTGWLRTVRFARHAVYEALMLTHRLGLRRGGRAS